MTEISRRTLRILTAAVLVAAVASTGAAAASSRSAAVAGVRAELAYVTGDGNPYISWVRPLAGGAARRVGHGANVLLSPDGARVADTSYATTGSGLRIVSLTGGVTRAYYNLARATPSALAWSADSRYLAVGVTPASGTSGGRLDVVDTRTGRVHTIIRGAVCGASFSPDSTDQLVFSIAKTYCLESSSNLYEAARSWSYHRTTSDGRSAYPVWSTGGIAFDRFKGRGTNAAPAMQIWLMAPGRTGERQVTRITVPPLLYGLEPVAASSDGKRLLARLVGEDTDSAYAVSMATGKATELLDGADPVQAQAISRDGRTVLVDAGAFENPPNLGRLETMPFTGGKPTVLVRHSVSGSWTR